MPKNSGLKLNNQPLISDYIVEIFSGRTSGIIHSMFSNSINIKVDGELININSKHDFLSSFGLMTSKATIDEALKFCESGNVVVIKNHEVILFGRAKEVKISLAHAKTVNLEIPKVSAINILQSKVMEKLESLNLSEKIGMENTPRLEQIMCYLSESSLEDMEMNEDLMKYLIGRGKGLTPSGDDFLIGFTMMLMSIEEDRHWTLHLAKMIQNKSTDISLAYYKALLDGHLSSYLKDFLQSIQRLDQPNIDKNILTIIGYGHTSGYDTLLGVYIACQWIKNNIIKRSVN